MDEHDAIDILIDEGFDRVYTWEDGSNAYYDEHEHSEVTAHIIISGEMAIEMDGQVYFLKAGERFDVPAGAVHSATMGPDGCRYVVGE